MDTTQNTVAIFNKYASEYQRRFMDVHLYHESLALFCDHLRGANPEILEIACGPGNLTQYLLKKRPGLRLLGIDLAPNMLELARKNNPGARFECMDARDIGRLDKPFDGIVCGFCLPYLSKAEALQLIADAALLLQAEGVLYLSTMEDHYSKSGLKTSSQGDQAYQYFHEAGYLSDALQANGFRIWLLDRKIYPAPDGTPTTDLLIVAGKWPKSRTN